MHTHVNVHIPNMRATRQRTSKIVDGVLHVRAAITSVANAPPDNSAAWRSPAAPNDCEEKGDAWHGEVDKDMYCNSDVG